MVTAPSSDDPSNDGRSEAVYVGLDAGGTGTTLVVGTSRETLREERGPGVNLQLDGVETTADRLARAITSVVGSPRGSGSDSGPGRAGGEEADVEKEADVEIGGLCVGLAGAGRSAGRARLRSRLAPPLRLSEGRVRIIEDDRLALEAAFPDGAGVVVMAGTGSVVRGRDRAGATHRAGGWGPVLGDEGGGRDLGRHAARAAAHQMDGGPETELRERLRSEWGVRDRDDLIRLIHEREVPLAQLAPLLLEAAREGDEVALAILEERLDRLVRRVAWMVGRPGWSEGEERLVLGGGLTESDQYRSTFRRLLSTHLPGWSFGLLDRSPATAAWELARSLRDDR